MSAQVMTGLAGLAADGPPPTLRGRRVGVLTHPAAILPDATQAVDVLRAIGLDVRLLLGAEHGLRGTAQAGESEPGDVDPSTGLRILDTYRQSSAELGQQLNGVDVVVVDLQHSGARFYTYESTLHDVLHACAEADVDVVVLDRPNPLGGAVVDGPVLELEYASFVGRSAIPLRHGLTLGELAMLFAKRNALPEPEIVPMRGWRRGMLFADTGLPWVPPSPNLPTAISALCYAGTCLFEGVNVSVGRGTANPFELVGAPWIDSGFAQRLRQLGLAGVVVREAYFEPTADVYAGTACCGVQLHVTEPRTFDPLRTAMHLLAELLRGWPERAEFRAAHFDLLVGTTRIREALSGGLEADRIVASWRAESAAFRDERREFLLYDT